MDSFQEENITSLEEPKPEVEWFLNSSQNSTPTAKAPGRDEDLAKIEMAVLALLFILTVLGNSVVLLGIFFRRQKMTRMYYFILHLTFADLITAFFNVLTQLFWEITYRFRGGNILCKFVKYTQILGPYSSSYVLVMTALDRYQAICFPLSNCNWTAKRSKIMLGVAWTISLIFCIPQIFIFSYRQVMDDPPEFDCWADFPAVWATKAYVTWYSITVFIVPLIILVFAYGCITRAIWINFNQKTKGQYEDQWEQGINLKRLDSEEGDPESTRKLDKNNLKKSQANEEEIQRLIPNGRGVSSAGPGTGSCRRISTPNHLFPRCRTGSERRSSSSFSRSSESRASSTTRFSRRGRKSMRNSNGVEQPRTHSVKGISRAKIKTVKLTVTIITTYFLSSMPFISAQLWYVYDPDATKSAFFSGPTFTILTLLASLNSCVNPYIFLFFNPNLLENCFRGIFHPRFPPRRGNNTGSPALSRTLSQNRSTRHFTGNLNRAGSVAVRNNQHESIRESTIEQTENIPMALGKPSQTQTQSESGKRTEASELSFKSDEVIPMQCLQTKKKATMATAMATLHPSSSSSSTSCRVETTTFGSNINNNRQSYSTLIT